jgi:hypothetical protein
VTIGFSAIEIGSTSNTNRHLLHDLIRTILMLSRCRRSSLLRMAGLCAPRFHHRQLA